MLILLLLLLAAGAVFGGIYYGYHTAFYSPNKDRDKLPSTSGNAYDPYRAEMKRMFHLLNDRPYEFVTITSHDGLTLSGRYYHVADGAPLDIGFHGYRSSPLTDFSGGSQLSFRMGHNLLLIDQRAHGKSQGNTISFGILERRDLLGWVDWGLQRLGPDTKIVLYGISMGGATVLMASELELPENVRAIIADCPYASPLDIILHVGRKTAFPQCLIRPCVILGARLFGGFDLLETTAAQAVAHSRTPILILHGEADNFVPCQMSDLIACNPELVERHTFPGADHGISFLADGSRYEKIVTDFLGRVL